MRLNKFITFNSNFQLKREILNTKWMGSVKHFERLFSVQTSLCNSLYTPLSWKIESATRWKCFLLKVVIVTLTPHLLILVKKKSVSCVKNLIRKRKSLWDENSFRLIFPFWVGKDYTRVTNYGQQNWLPEADWLFLSDRWK